MAAPADPQTLRAFVAVAREGNVSRAAARLHLSQPAVSLQLKALAESTGLSLFTRTSHGLALTPDGAALLPQAEKALAALADFGQAALSLHSTVRGRLRIGTILDPEFIRLGAFLKELVETAPQIETELRQGMSGEVLAQIGRGELDVGFYLGLPGETQEGPYEARVLSHFSYCVLAPAGWGEQVLGRDWKALAALPWIATPPTSAHHRLLAGVFAPLGVSPRQVALVDRRRRCWIWCARVWACPWCASPSPSPRRRHVVWWWRTGSAWSASCALSACARGAGSLWWRVRGRR